MRRSASGVKETLKAASKLANYGPAIVERLSRIPLQIQIPACAIEAGLAPTRGNDTSNDSEIFWPMVKNARREPDQYEQWLLVLAVYQGQIKRVLTLQQQAQAEYQARRDLRVAVPPKIYVLMQACVTPSLSLPGPQDASLSEMNHNPIPNVGTRQDSRPILLHLHGRQQHDRCCDYLHWY
jgi:hypothetical protein